jgi:chaperone BCS1
LPTCRIDDYTLGRLIRDTPSRCILLIESVNPTESHYCSLITNHRDIDCAFPSREDDDDEPQLDLKGNPIPKEPIPPRSQVTLAGLLNVLDSVASEEGRLTFATVRCLFANVFEKKRLIVETRQITSNSWIQVIK